MTHSSPRPCMLVTGLMSVVRCTIRSFNLFSIAVFEQSDSNEDGDTQDDSRGSREASRNVSLESVLLVSWVYLSRRAQL